MDYATRTTLLTRLSDGVDPSAWREFHERYAKLIRGFAVRQGLQSADCDDVVQEVLLALTRSMKRFEYDPARGKFRSYLKTLALRSVFRESRKRRSRFTLGENEVDAVRAPAGPADPTDSMWEIEWRRHHMRRAMQQLKSEFNDRDRMAFTVYAMQGCPAERASRVLGMSIDQVYQAKSRILRRLTELIAKQVTDEG